MPSRSRLNVFISYRRDDASGNAGRLFDWLTRQFGRSRVFLDTDKIAHGADFAEVLKARLHDADVVLVVIGRAWLDIANAAGRRLDQPDDFVRMEVATALELAASGGTRVIPVLVDGAGMPAASDLPQPLQGLARLNAASLRDAGFEQDFDLLVDDMLGRPRGYLRTELDRLQRLLQALKVSSLLVPVVAVFVVLALWMGVLDEFTLDTKAASYLLWAGEQLAPAPDDPGVLLVTIDEGSEAQLQRPFGPTPAWRADHARLIERATAAGAKAVVFDLFSNRRARPMTRSRWPRNGRARGPARPGWCSAYARLTPANRACCPRCRRSPTGARYASTVASATPFSRHWRY